MSSNSPPSPGPDLFFAGGECLTRFGVWERRTDMDLEAATRDIHTRASDAVAAGRDGILRSWEIDKLRAEWLAEVDLDPTRNQLRASAQMDSPTIWPQTNVTPEGDFVDPFGGRTAVYLSGDDTGGSALHGITQTMVELLRPSTDYTVSVFAKRNGRDFLRLEFDGLAGTGVGGAWFDLRNGVVASVGGSTFGAQIVTSGAGFFRCSFFADSGVGSAPATLRITVADQDGFTNYTGDGDSGIIVVGAQLELGQTATNPQTKPRDPARRFPSMLLENGVTNGWTESENLGPPPWSDINNATIVQNVAIAPDGNANADRLVEDNTAAVQHFIQRETPTIADDTAQAFSCYVRAAGRSEIAMAITLKNATTARAFFNLGTGIPGTKLAGVRSTSMTRLPFGWFRCAIVATSSESGANVTRGLVELSDGSENITYDGNGVGAVDLWGMQFEADRTATSSYIKTGSTTVQRSSDVFKAPFLHSPTPMTVYARWVEVDQFQLSPNKRLFNLSEDGNETGAFFRVFNGGNGDAVRLDFRNNAGANVQISAAAGLFKVGDLAEVRAIYRHDNLGGVLVGARRNGGPETIVENSDDLAVNAVRWGDSVGPVMWVSNVNGTDRGDAKWLALKVHRGVRGMDFMRAL